MCWSNEILQSQVAGWYQEVVIQDGRLPTYIQHIPWEAGELIGQGTNPLLRDGDAGHLRWISTLPVSSRTSETGLEYLCQPTEETISKLESTETDILLKKEIVASMQHPGSTSTIIVMIEL